MLAAALLKVLFYVQAGNYLTKELLRRLTHSGKIYLIPVTIRNKYIIRFTVTSQFTTAEDILRDWAIISETAAALLAEARPPGDTLSPKSVKDAVVGGEETTVMATTFHNGAAAGLEKGEVELWIDKTQKQAGTPMHAPSCNSEPLPYTCFETKNGHMCEEKAMLNGTAAVPAAKPKSAVQNDERVQ